MNFTIEYTTDGKSAAVIKRDIKYLSSALNEAAKACSCNQLPYDFHPFYWQMSELHDRLEEKLKCM